MSDRWDSGFGDRGVYQTDEWATAERAQRAMASYGRDDSEEAVERRISSLVDAVREGSASAETGGVLVRDDDSGAVAVYVRVGTLRA